MGIEHKAEIEIDVKGAERAAAAARGSLLPWTELAQRAKDKFKELRGEVASAVGSVVSDLGRVVTAGSAISFAGAVQGVQSFEKATAQLATASGRDLDLLRKRYEELGTQLGEMPQDVANFVHSTGRQIYNFEEPEKNLRAFSKLAKETGRSVGDMGGLQVAFKRLGIDDADKGLRQLRANAESLKTVGGVAALADQFAALSGTLSKTSNNASQLQALVGVLGKGLKPGQAQEVQQGIVGGLVSQAAQYEAHFHRQGILKPGDHVIDPKTGQVDVVKLAQLRQQELVRRFGRDKAMRVASVQFGSSQAGAAFLNADFGKVGGLTGQEADTDALEKYNNTDAGKRALNDAKRAAGMRDLVGSGSLLGGLRQRYDDLTAGHPIVGKGVELTAAVLGHVGGGYLRKWIAGEVIKRGGAEGLKRGGLELLKRGAPRLAAIGEGLVGAPLALAGVAAFQAKAMLNLKVDRAEYQREAEGGGYGVYGAGVGGSSAGRARALVRAAMRSGGTEEGFIRQVGAPLLAQAGYDPKGAPLPAEQAAGADPVLKTLFEQLRGGSSELKGLGKEIGREVAEALKGSPLQITVNDNTLAGVAVEHQPGGEQ